MGGSRIVETLLAFSDPSIRWRTRVEVLGEDPETRANRERRREIRRSPRVQALLAHRDASLGVAPGLGVYAKWQGPHWILAALGDLGYPPGDPALFPLRDRVLDHWLAAQYYREFEANTRAGSYGPESVPRIDGRYRRRASQQGNALLSVYRLGLADDRTERLTERLLRWQWPDGGWNCDREPSASHSSFMETILPMLGLAVHARATGNDAARSASERASEVFLGHRLYRRNSDGRPMRPEFVQLYYPRYWHYDVLGGLRAMVEMGSIRDPRCGDALDLLESKRLLDGGWPTERRYYRVRPGRFEANADYVDWGPVGRRRMNPWVTLDALRVLAAAGRSSG